MQKKEPRLEDKCKARLGKHFGPIVSSVYVNKTFTPEAMVEGHKIFEAVRTELVRTLKDTPWMYNETRDAIIEKASEAEAMIGFSQQVRSLLKLLYPAIANVLFLA
jgi:predicted metalloendopeptidase